VIAMTLDHVGSYEGPDLSTFERIRANVPAHTTVIGAGGIRDAHDLVRAEHAGATAWLVASALHDGRIGRVGPMRASDLAPHTPATDARADHTNSMPDDEAHTAALRCKETASR
jgi:phosphoribosylformimino-5-aminoimidazole carboxamide ribotide isomerase